MNEETFSLCQHLTTEKQTNVSLCQTMLNIDTYSPFSHFVIHGSCRFIISCKPIVGKFSFALAYQMQA